MEAGTRGLSRYEEALASYDPQDFSFQFSENDPSYQFRLQEGNRATDRAVAARGGLASGNRALALANYAQGAASQEYAAEFGRALQTYQTNSANQINRLNAYKGLADYGLSAAAQTAGQSGALTNSMVQSVQAAGAGQAAGIMGVGSSITSGIKDYSYLSGLNSSNNYITQGVGANIPVSGGGSVDFGTPSISYSGG
jgi:hypothetical protein